MLVFYHFFDQWREFRLPQEIASQEKRAFDLPVFQSRKDRR